MIKRLSASSIKVFETCPLQWQYQYVFGLMQLPNPNFIIGKAYHKSLEDFHQGISKSLILERLKKDLIRKETTREFERYGLVRKMFNAYVDNPVEGHIISLEKKFSIDIDGIDVPLVGIMDRMDVDKTVEYKTSSVDYKQEDIDNIQSKIYFYARYKLFGDILPIKYSINNKLKAKRNNSSVKTLEISYEQKNIKEIEDYLRYIYDEMRNVGNTPTLYNKSYKCSWCAYSKKGTGNCPYN